MRQAPDANSVRSAYSPATLPSCTRQTRLQAPRVELRWEIMTTVLSAKRKTVPVSRRQIRDERRCFVYSCCGRENTSAVSPISTISPSFITAMRLQMEATTSRLWEI